MNQRPTIIAALDDSRLFGTAFTGPTGDNWKTLLAAMDGLPLSRKQEKFFFTLPTPIFPLQASGLLLLLLLKLGVGWTF